MTAPKTNTQPKRSEINYTDRYLNFLTSLMAKSNQQKKFTLSSVITHNKVPWHAYEVAKSLNFFKELESIKNRKAIHWLPTRPPCMQLAKRLHDECIKFKKDEYKASYKKNKDKKALPQSQQSVVINQPSKQIMQPIQLLSKAKLEINGVNIVIPTYNGEVELEVAGNHIKISL
jgi:hypothetical protein